VGNADGPVAGDKELRIAGAVALKGGTVAVEFPTVELGDQPGGGPEDVDLFAEDLDVGAVWRQVEVAAEAPEPFLERRAGWLLGVACCGE
jgi:hypothetical protein